jgi:AraC-like DNA-binding protein
MRKPDAKGLGALPSATGQIARLAYTQAKKAGIDVGPLLQQAGITPHQIEHTDERLKVQDQILFLNLTADALHDELLGFHLGQLPDLRELGLLYYVSASSGTLSEALGRVSRYSRIANEGVWVKYLDDGEIKITFHYLGVSRYLDRHQLEFFMTLLIRQCRHLSGLQVMPSHVRLAHRRTGGSSEFVEFFGGNVEFGADVDELALPPTARNLPVVSADPHLNKLLINYCEEALSRRPANRGSFRSKVENEVVQLLPHGKARAGEIARRLGVSQRTLTRSLAAEGLTFSGVLESLRVDLARRYLAEKELSISQIAWLLGYQEVSAFTHAFKRWNGETPRQARSPRAS